MLRQYLEKLARAKLLSPDKVALALESLPGWVYVSFVLILKTSTGKLHKVFEFRNYEDASYFISRYTSQCTKLNHTPEW